MIKELAWFWVHALIIAVSIAVGMGLIIGLVTFALDSTEEQECRAWKDQAVEYPNFYITSWQKQQCDFHQISIEAPVK